LHTTDTKDSSLYIIHTVTTIIAKLPNAAAATIFIVCHKSGHVSKNNEKSLEKTNCWKKSSQVMMRIITDLFTEVINTD